MGVKGVDNDAVAACTGVEVVVIIGDRAIPPLGDGEIKSLDLE